MDLEANKALIMRFAEAVNASDLDALDGLFTQDFRRHCQATPDVQINSLEEFKDFQKGFVVGFPDQRVSAEMIIAEGDYVATYGTYKATHTGPMGDIPATGKAVDVKMLTIFRIQEGKIAELWVEWDNMAMLAQLGLFPPPGPTDA
jgi:steroid delta-isomerase-like uncharacterized protein